PGNSPTWGLRPQGAELLLLLLQMQILKQTLRQPALPSSSSLGSFWMKKDQPTQQAGIICELLLKDYEYIMKVYDRILNTKLAEQYKCFVKFTYDQITQAMCPEAFLHIWGSGLTSREGGCKLFATGLIPHFSYNFAS
ncbi:Akirin-1, partial [Galemys pyrenaicus]